MMALHWLAHLLGLHSGHVDTWWESDGDVDRLMVGFRCAGCGKLEGVHERLRKFGPAKPFPTQSLVADSLEQK